MLSQQISCEIQLLIFRTSTKHRHLVFTSQQWDKGRSLNIFRGQTKDQSGPAPNFSLSLQLLYQCSGQNIKNKCQRLVFTFAITFWLSSTSRLKFARRERTHRTLLVSTQTSFHHCRLSLQPMTMVTWLAFLRQKLIILLRAWSGLRLIWKPINSYKND